MIPPTTDTGLDCCVTPLLPNCPYIARPHPHAVLSEARIPKLNAAVVAEEPGLLEDAADQIIFPTTGTGLDLPTRVPSPSSPLEFVPQA